MYVVTFFLIFFFVILDLPYRNMISCLPKAHPNCLKTCVKILKVVKALGNNSKI